MASIAKLAAESGDIPNKLPRLNTKLLVSSATAISIIGRQILYLLIPSLLTDCLLNAIIAQLGKRIHFTIKKDTQPYKTGCNYSYLNLAFVLIDSHTMTISHLLRAPNGRVIGAD